MRTTAQRRRVLPSNLMFVTLGIAKNPAGDPFVLTVVRCAKHMARDITAKVNAVFFADDDADLQEILEVTG